MEIPYGYCHCGCGEKTKLNRWANKTRGYLKGEPRRFIHNHHCKGENGSKWKGGRVFGGGDGNYVRILQKDNPRASRQGYVYEHILSLADSLGTDIPASCVVHHKDRNTQNNNPDNLVLCQDQSEHAKIHVEERIFAECGHSDWRRCRYCHQLDSLENLKSYSWKGQMSHYHNECNNRYHREYMRTK